MNNYIYEISNGYFRVDNETFLIVENSFNGYTYLYTPEELRAEPPHKRKYLKTWSELGGRSELTEKERCLYVKSLLYPNSQIL